MKITSRVVDFRLEKQKNSVFCCQWYSSAVVIFPFEL